MTIFTFKTRIPCFVLCPQAIWLLTKFLARLSTCEDWICEIEANWWWWWRWWSEFLLYARRSVWIVCTIYLTVQNLYQLSAERKNNFPNVTHLSSGRAGTGHTLATLGLLRKLSETVRKELSVYPAFLIWTNGWLDNLVLRFLFTDSLWIHSEL